MIPNKTTHYVKQGKVYTRCSRCRKEFQRKPEARIVGADGERIVEPEPLGMLTLGNELLALVCNDCHRAVCYHLLAIWPDSEAFVYVEPKTNELVPTTRCGGCAMPRGMCEACEPNRCCSECTHYPRLAAVQHA